MVKINPLTLNNKHQRIFFRCRCIHRHLYSEHPNCFVNEIMEKNGERKEGYLDIESTGFEANYHHILSYVIKTRGKDEYCTAVLTKKDLDDEIFDKRICEQLIEDLAKYDLIYTYYGTGFDIPFMRARCLYWKLPFPEFGTMQHKDVYYMVKRLLKLNRKSLEVATKFLGIEGKNHCLGIEWMLARIGNKKGLDYILDHNIKDCIILEKLHNRIANFSKRTTKSI